MKYCQHCGSQIMDETIVCPTCGCAVESNTAKSEQNVLKTVAKIFMLLSCIGSAILLIPLCWTIPMTVHYWKSVDKNTPVGTGFKVCSLLFVNLIAGILMLCDNDEKKSV